MFRHMWLLCVLGVSCVFIGDSNPGPHPSLVHTCRYIPHLQSLESFLNSYANIVFFLIWYKENEKVGH